MSSIVIVGAGGHAREVLEILISMESHGQSVEVVGFVDDNPQLHDREINGVPVLGGIQWLVREQSRVEVICAIGAPDVRCELVERIADLGYRFASAISPYALISPHARIGQGVMIFPNTVIGPNVSVGNHAILNVGATVSHDSLVGDFCTINPSAHLAGNVHLGAKSSVGMGANVIQGVSIGCRTVIGAGAVVVRDLPPSVTAVGVPARVIKTHTHASAQ